MSTHTTTNAAIEQPPPSAGTENVLPTAIRYAEQMNSAALVPDLNARAAMGYTRYGTYLQTHNGRDAAMDCYQELLDGLMYIMQAMMELPPGDVHKLSRIRMNVLISLDCLKDYLDGRTE